MWIADFGVEANYQDNISRSPYSADKKGDFTLTPSMVFGRYFGVGAHTGLTATANLKADFLSKYDQLNNIEATGAVTLIHRFGVGTEAPSLRAHVSYGQVVFKESYRDSWIGEAGLEVSKWFTDRLELSAGWLYDRRMPIHEAAVVHYYMEDIDVHYLLYHRPSNVYELDGNTGRINAIYLLTPDDALSLGYSIRGGDVVSEATPGKSVVKWSKAITESDVFDGLAAYRIGATTHTATVSVSHAVADRSSINLGYDYQNIKGDWGLNYINNVIRLAFLYSW
ncbi:MAG: hypothetical protein HY751_08220 [Nitrospinae bacterium]|nr:hypothetical protein [Nitrospinota bacterium]